MPRARRAKRNRRGPAGPPPGTEAPEEGRRSGRALLTWVAGILSAVIAAVVGVVFTGWFGSLGPGAFDELSGVAAPFTVAYVSIRDDPDLALREPVATARDRAILLGIPEEGERAEFMERHHAAPVGNVTAIAVLNGNRSSLRIADLRPRILSRGPVSAGALLRPAGAGEAGTIEIRADLDRKAPRFMPVEGNDKDTPYFESQQIDLARDERATLIMTFTARKAYYEFDIVATVVTGDGTEEVVIRGPGDRPFRVTGPAPDYRAEYSESPQGGWAIPTPGPPLPDTKER